MYYCHPSPGYRLGCATAIPRQAIAWGVLLPSLARLSPGVYYCHPSPGYRLGCATAIPRQAIAWGVLLPSLARLSPGVCCCSSVGGHVAVIKIGSRYAPIISTHPPPPTAWCPWATSCPGCKHPGQEQAQDHQAFRPGLDDA